MVRVCLGETPISVRLLMNMGRGLGESGQYNQNRIMFITTRKRKFGIPTNDPLHEFRLLPGIVEQVIDIIFGRHGNGHRKTSEFPKELLSVFTWRYMTLCKEGLQLFLIWTISEGGEWIFMSDSQ